MFQIPVYSAEREAGVAELVRSSASVRYAAQATLCDRFGLSERDLSLLKAGMVTHRARAGLDDFDLHYIKDILVSTGCGIL